MPNKKILFADNNLGFLNAWTAMLQIEGYEVTPASTPLEARNILLNKWNHLAIFDVRLTDDNDNLDKSGLLLALDLELQAIPKIILTLHVEDYRIATEALRPGPDGRGAAVNFCGKEEGTQALLNAINQAFESHIHINWDLDIEWNSQDNFYLVNQITPGLKNEQLMSAASEMEDLFRKVFFSAQRIIVEKVIWQRNGRVALSIVVIKNGEPPQSRLVVCGAAKPMFLETTAFTQFAPKVGDTVSILVENAETTHYSANAYILANADLERVYTLGGLYRTASERVFNNTLNILFQKNLASWHQDKWQVEETKTLDAFYRERLNLNENQVSPEKFLEQLQLLIRKLPTVGLEITKENDSLVFHLGRKSFKYSNPSIILHQSFETGQSILTGITPGVLQEENILTDDEKRVWLTDFAEAGPAPILWNYVSLEAVIRFDWLETNKYLQLHGVEQSLIDLEEFNNLHTDTADVAISRALRAILEIRKLAGNLIQKDPLSYQLGLLFFAIGGIATAKLSSHLPQRELIRLSHMLLAAAMLTENILKSGAKLTTKEAIPPFVLDKAKREVKVKGKVIDLTKTEFNLLEILNEKPGELVSRKDLYERLFNNTFDKYDSSQNSHLNTNVGRLRKKIEPDSSRDQFLITEPGVGYKLITSPENFE